RAATRTSRRRSWWAKRRSVWRSARKTLARRSAEWFASRASSRPITRSSEAVALRSGSATRKRPGTRTIAEEKRNNLLRRERDVSCSRRIARLSVDGLIIPGAQVTRGQPSTRRTARASPFAASIPCGLVVLAAAAGVRAQQAADILQSDPGDEPVFSVASPLGPI